MHVHAIVPLLYTAVSPVRAWASVRLRLVTRKMCSANLQALGKGRQGREPSKRVLRCFMLYFLSPNCILPLATGGEDIALKSRLAAKRWTQEACARQLIPHEPFAQLPLRWKVCRLIAELWRYLVSLCLWMWQAWTSTAAPWSCPGLPRRVRPSGARIHHGACKKPLSPRCTSQQS